MVEPFMRNRRDFLQTCAAGLTVAVFPDALPAHDRSLAAEPSPVLHLEADSKRPLIPVLSWDTEGGGRARSNLLRSGAGVGLRVRDGGGWRDGIELPAEVHSAADSTRYRLQLTPDCALRWDVTVSSGTLTMTFASEGSEALSPGSVEMVFPFDPMVTPTTVLPSLWRENGGFAAPLVISSPDFGQMHLQASPAAQVTGRLEGSRDNHTVDIVVELPGIDLGHVCSLDLSPVTLQAPAGLEDQSFWRSARRGWYNAFQSSARWGPQNRPFSAPAGILANNVISDPCSFSSVFYADHMLWTPIAAEGVSLANLVRRTAEFWLDQRTRSNGEVVGYWDYGNFLDSNTGPVVAAWGYVEATGDLSWLEKRIANLEYVSDFLARRDQDLDGLVEATQSGNAGTLFNPDRSCNWFDAVNHGHKDAYSNALIYRSWRCLADLEAKLHREPQRQRYAGLADKLKAAYSRILLNPATGWIADWRSDDGKLHDYASPVANGLAIEYGLVPRDLGRGILDRLWAKMDAAGFRRFELGIPPNLDPIHRSDYLQPDGFGCPSREDGTDTFQQYENGGITGGQILHFLAANYRVGYGEKADRVLRAMLQRQQEGGFQNGVQNAAFRGIDWTTWDGKPCGYEGYLADVYYFLQAVLLRESRFRDRFYRPLET